MGGGGVGRASKGGRRLRLAGLGLLLCALLGCGNQTAGGGSADGSRRAAEQRATVAYVVDGDTLRVRLESGDLAYVRLVGVDTPEDVRPGSPIECGSRAAASSMRQLAPEGASVILRRDSVADATDRYGRILAHAFIGNRQLEVAQLRRGWAEVYRFEDQRFDGLSRFESAEARARQAHRRVWGSCGGDFHSSR